MSNLLVGCKVTMNIIDIGEIKGIVVKVGTKGGLNTPCVWILDKQGKISVWEIYGDIEIDPEDLRFITSLNKNYKLRKEMLEEKVERFEMLDL